MDLPVNSKVSPSTISTTTLTSTITSTPTTTTTQPPITDDMADVVVVQKTRRVSHLLSWAKYVLIYLSIWQLILITCQLLLTIGSSFRRRSTLPMGHDRHFYWLNFALTIPLIVWWVWSITAIRRRDNLTIITLLGLFALIFILFDIIILGRMVTFGLSIAQGFNSMYCSLFLIFTFYFFLFLFAQNYQKF